ncbi:hypothetical protein [Actinomadura opuntiae]|uniref:hypothetical protein n=1 Tax=Actinomadura sp. OS1-43 TaxID=604315 RepID=UPI00255B1C22|nr:hypothetical protein [Actinomadura sp. OS1-43]MDL4817188.1 hypothetical protein [Actinomadura sp. OS1-43]
MRTASLEDAADLPDDANVVLLLRRRLVSRELRRLFRRMRVLLVPIASFDPSPAVAEYTLRLVCATDYVAACEWNRYWARSISEQPGLLRFEGNGTDLTCSLADRLHADAWLDPRIGFGKWVSVASFCEFSITAPSSTDWRGAFDIAGTAVASGLLVARDARVRPEGDERIRRATRLREEIAARAPIDLRLADGMLAEVRAGGVDYTEAVIDVTNPAYEGHTIELGLGTNMALLPQVNWALNSQLNEGAGTLHLGFGEGMTGAHMDFVVAECEHRFQKDGAEAPR